AMVKRTLGALGCKLVLEPGRMITGNAGILISRVLYVKKGTLKSFIIQDAAMNDLIRPTLYDAWHEIIPVTEPVDGAPEITADIVGPVCETGDYFALDRKLPDVGHGDLLAIMTAGASCAAQSGTHKRRPLIAEVLVKGSKFDLVRPRQTYDELIGLDHLAAWQEKRRREARPSVILTLSGIHCTHAARPPPPACVYSGDPGFSPG